MQGLCEAEQKPNRRDKKHSVNTVDIFVEPNVDQVLAAAFVQVWQIHATSTSTSAQRQQITSMFSGQFGIQVYRSKRLIRWNVTLLPTVSSTLVPEQLSLQFKCINENNITDFVRVLLIQSDEILSAEALRTLVACMPSLSLQGWIHGMSLKCLHITPRQVICAIKERPSNPLHQSPISVPSHVHITAAGY